MSPLNGADDDDFTPSKTPKSSSKSGNGAGVNGGGSRKKNSLTVQRIYELMYEVYATAPATLSPVLPLVEMKLKVSEFHTSTLHNYFHISHKNIANRFVQFPT